MYTVSYTHLWWPPKIAGRLRRKLPNTMNICIYTYSYTYIYTYMNFHMHTYDGHEQLRVDRVENPRKWHQVNHWGEQRDWKGERYTCEGARVLCDTLVGVVNGAFHFHLVVGPVCLIHVQNLHMYIPVGLLYPYVCINLCTCINIHMQYMPHTCPEPTDVYTRWVLIIICVYVCMYT